MRRNYHSHTYRCRHAGEFQDEQYVLAAIENGYEFYGFSDHVPWPFRDGLAQTTRMETHEFPGYVESICGLAEKYKDRIEIKLGLECEGYVQHFDYLKELRKSVDYLILGHHFSPNDTEQTVYYGGKKVTAEHLDQFAGEVSRALESGLFCLLAHPDIPLAHYPVWDEHCEALAHAVCKTAAALDIPIEYNLLGQIKTEQGRSTGLGYPCEQFWRVAKQYNPRVIVSLDAHSPTKAATAVRFDNACAWLDDNGFRRIDRLF